MISNTFTTLRKQHPAGAGQEIGGHGTTSRAEDRKPETCRFLGDLVNGVGKGAVCARTQ
jgi:hypothetical protein